jgi:hypothetical protein
VNTSQRRIVLGVALLASLVATRWVGSQEEASSEKPRGKPVEPAQVIPPSASPRSSPADAQSAAPEALIVEKLNRAKSAATADNLFESNAWQPPPKPLAKPPPPPPPTPPALPFSYFGKMSDDGQTIVFLNAADRSYAVRIGDVLDGRYKIDDIKERTMVLTYLPLQQQQTLNIGD